MNYSGRDMTFIARNPQARAAFQAGDFGRLQHLVIAERQRQSKELLLTMLRGHFRNGQIPILVLQNPFSQPAKEWIRGNLVRTGPYYSRILDELRG